jgi:FixJ family two-component response regulator
MLVPVVDDDESVRESLPDLLQVCAYGSRAFSSAEEFLASGAVRKTGCLILDVATPGMSGPELMRELSFRQEPVPIVFVTAHDDESDRSRLLGDGAVECLFEPFSESALLQAVERGLRRR